MKRLDPRILIGGGLVLMGALMFAERLGLFRGALDIFWGLAFIVVAVYFLYRFARNRETDWWAVIPGLTLAGLAAETLVPRLLGHRRRLLLPGCTGALFLCRLSRQPSALVGYHPRWSPDHSCLHRFS